MSGPAATRPWMPFYVRDYLGDTSHLSTVEHGAYLLLIMHYWLNGGLPADDTKLARIARLPLAEWAARSGYTLLSSFDGRRWQHKRGRRRAGDYRRRNIERRATRWASKAALHPGWRGRGEPMLKQCFPKNEAMLEQC